MHVNNDITLFPTPKCWGDVEGDIDLSSIADIFRGKKKEEIKPLLRENYIVRCLDLAGMPDRVFGYYALCFADFALNEVNDEEWFSVVLGAFLDAICRKRKYSPLFYANFLQQALPLLDRLLERLKNSSIDLEIRSELMNDFEEARSIFQV